MASHCGSVLHALHVVEHHPRILKVTFKLHAFNQVYSTFGTFSEHLENVHLLFALSKENAVVYEFKHRLLLHGHDVVDDTSTVV